MINVYKEIDRGCIRSIELIKGKKGNKFAIKFITFIYSLFHISYMHLHINLG